MLLIATPTEHLKKFRNHLEESGIIYYDFPNLTNFNSIPENQRKLIKYIFLNPNKQKFVFDNLCHQFLPNLTDIFTASTGTLHIQKDYFDNHGVKIHSLKNDIELLENISSTAELAFLFLLSAIRNYIPSMQSVHQMEWNYEPFTGHQVKDLNIGVVGLGRLGKIFTRFCNTFGASVYYFDPHVFVEGNKLIKVNSLDDLMRLCDVVSLHVHPETKPIINNLSLKNVKEKKFILINTSRGEVVDEHAIISCLDQNHNFKYFTDVIINEQSSKETSPVYINFINDVFKDRLQVTPHLGGSTFGAQELAYNHTLKKVFNVMDGLQ